MPQMSISTLVISDLDRFIKIKDCWDRDLKDHVDDPFLSGCMIEEQWKMGLKLGWQPLLFVFLAGDRIVGFALLILKARFGLVYASSFDQYMSPDFFSDDYREVCIDKMVDFLFGHLNCESADITFEDGSANQRVLEEVCGKRGFKFTRSSQEGQAIIPVNKSLELFRGSLDRRDRKEFRRFGRKLDKLGKWRISCFDVNRSSVEKVLAIEKFSWKIDLHGKDKAIKDWGIEIALRGAQRGSQGKRVFESEVCFLEVNNEPIAYVLVLKQNQTVFFAKTSYDQRFKAVSPGKFLMNDLIEQIFKENSAKKIDFYSNLPVTRVWKPLVKQRVTIKIQKRSFLSKFVFLVFDNQISSHILKFINRLKWEKKSLIRVVSKLTTVTARPYFICK